MSDSLVSKIRFLKVKKVNRFFLYIQILGWRLEDFDEIVQFTAKMSTDPAFSSDVAPKFYLNVSLALWYVLLQWSDVVQTTSCWMDW